MANYEATWNDPQNGKANKIQIVYSDGPASSPQTVIVDDIPIGQESAVIENAEPGVYAVRGVNTDTTPETVGPISNVVEIEESGGGSGEAIDPRTLPGTRVLVVPDQGLWQDIDKTIPATSDGDPVLLWENQIEGEEDLIKTNATPHSLASSSYNGQPTLRSSSSSSGSGSVSAPNIMLSRNGGYFLAMGIVRTSSNANTGIYNFRNEEGEIINTHMRMQLAATNRARFSNHDSVIIALPEGDLKDTPNIILGLAVGNDLPDSHVVVAYVNGEIVGTRESAGSSESRPVTIVEEEKRSHILCAVAIEGTTTPEERLGIMEWIRQNYMADLIEPWA